MAKMRAKQKKRATARAARDALATLAPKRPNPADDTRRNREYTRRLVREGVEFYTVFRPTWTLHAMRWTREYR